MSIESWRQWAVIEKGLAPRTVKGYERALRDLGPEIAEYSTAELREVLHVSGGSPSTVAGRLAAWRSYFRWLVKTEQRADDPTVRLDRPRVKRGLPKPVRDFERRIAILDPEYQAIAVLLRETGMRISEAKGLEVEVPLDPPYELTVLGKASKERIIPLTPEGHEALCYLGGRVRPSVRAIQRAFSVVGMHPHALRHTYASEIIASGGDIGDVQKLLGHASVATSQVYAAYDQPRLRAAAERRRPRRPS